MSLPSIVSYGAAAKTSTLVWDSDLTIPDGFAIESASGEVGIIGDVSISGALNSAKITGAVYPCTIASDTGTSTIVLTSSTPSNGAETPVCWAYKGTFTVSTGSKNVTAYGVDLDTGDWISQNLVGGGEINMFIAYLSSTYGSSNFSMSMLSPKNAIL